MRLSELDGATNQIAFQEALALQCFANEYVYAVTENEFAAVEYLGNLVETQLVQGKQPKTQDILILASYKGLYEYDWCDLLTITGEIKMCLLLELQVL